MDRYIYGDSYINGWRNEGAPITDFEGVSASELVSHSVSESVSYHQRKFSENLIIELSENISQFTIYS